MWVQQENYDTIQEIQQSITNVKTAQWMLGKSSQHGKFIGFKESYAQLYLSELS